MSVFTNPAAGAAGQARAYTQAVLDLLGGRDPFVVLRTTEDALRTAVAGMTDDQMATPERAGKWSVRQVLRHMADSEIVWAYRLRLILGQDRPTISGYDQDAWAERLAYAESDPADSLADFAAFRRSNLRVLEAASDDDLARVGVHAERGEESVERLVRLYAGHDLLHIRQIERIRGAV